MTRVLYVGPFDPACVGSAWARALRSFGDNVDMVCAVLRDFTYLGGTPDFCAERVDLDFNSPNALLHRASPGPMSVAVLREFARSADIVIECAATDDGLDSANIYRTVPPELRLEFRHDVKRIALIHGSAYLMLNAAIVAEEYRFRGYHVAATTLNYATAANCAWLPPTTFAGAKPLLFATQHHSDCVLRVIQSPTDPTLCATQTFIGASQRAGVQAICLNRIQHTDLLAFKALCHVGFDHFRGDFSVNALENAALGLVSLFALRDENVATSVRAGVAPPPNVCVVTEATLEERLRSLWLDAATCHDAQIACRNWFVENFAPKVCAQRLTKFFAEVM